MHYLVYRITNLINGRYYIGCHKTEDVDDGYMGSGVAIKAAIKKYGVSNFKKDVLFDLASLEEMFAKEREIITLNEQSYNLHLGGSGGRGGDNRGFSNKTHTLAVRRRIAKTCSLRKWTNKSKMKISLANKRTNASRGAKVSKALLGKPKSMEHRRKIAEAIKAKHLARKQLYLDSVTVAQFSPKEFA